MIFKNFIASLLLLPLFLYSQNNYKNIYYYDEQGNAMPQSEFFRLNSSQDYISNSYEEDSDLVKILIKRRREGTLPIAEYTQLKKIFPTSLTDPINILLSNTLLPILKPY